MWKPIVWLLILYVCKGVVQSIHNASLLPVTSSRTLKHEGSSQTHSSYSINVRNVSSVGKNVTIVLNRVSQNRTSLEKTITNRNITPSIGGSTSVTSLLVSTTVLPAMCDFNMTKKTTFYHNESCYSSSDPLKCFHDPIFCELHFASGHRDLRHKRPVYGEYSSLEQQRWFHVIQHGGIAFLFHPCTNKTEVEKMRRVASQCLHRYILAPYAKLTQDMPLALVTWGCYYIANKVNGNEMRTWISGHAYKGPASHVHTNGKYRVHLVKKSKVVTDVKDVIVCPSEEEKNQYYSPENIVSTTIYRKLIHRFDHEAIIRNRVIKLNKIKPGIQIIQANLTVTKVKAGSAAWAAASLIFLCGILVGWLVYTRQYPCGGQHVSTYKYNRVGDRDFESFECEPGESNFNMLKSNQKIMSAFRWRNSNTIRDKTTLAAVNAMVPIDEECQVDNDDDDDDDEETVFFSR